MRAVGTQQACSQSWAVLVFAGLRLSALGWVRPYWTEKGWGEKMRKVHPNGERLSFLLPGPTLTAFAFPGDI